MQGDQTSHNSIRFVLDGAVHEASNVEPTTTLLEYLREDLRRTGTKEGCAEGDCGACTVVVGELEPNANKVSLFTANACLQCLPTLDGKQLFTVESLGEYPDSLHPVQQSMVDKHASQCGFCTPGFVMSLFWLYKSQTRTNYNELLRVLSGNICRCTGYRPILDAGLAMHAYESEREDWLNVPGNDTPQDQHTLQLLSSLDTGTSLALRKSPTDGINYLAPVDLSELAGQYQKHPDATLLAGGTDIGIWITKTFRKFPMLIHTGRVAVLKQISITSKSIEIGSAVTLTQLIPTLLQEFPELDDFLNRFASLPIRNLATLGGNICNASPIGDSMPVLLSLGTELKLRKGNTTRTMALNEFYLDYQKTALQSGEFLESISIPRRAKGSKLGSYKISKRFDQDISAVCASFYLQNHDTGERKIRIAYGGVAAIPKRAYATEEFINRNPINPLNIAKALEILATEFTPLSDMRASAGYRSQVSENLLSRFLQRIWQGETDTRLISVRDYQHGT